MKRKIIQISQAAAVESAENGHLLPVFKIIALCDDGTLFEMGRDAYGLYSWKEISISYITDKNINNEKY